MHYNVRLDKGILTNGRQFMKALVWQRNNPTEGAKLPAGAAALLSLFNSQADERFNAYAESLGSDEPFKTSQFNEDFLPAMTQLTLAAELVLRFDGLLSTFYAPDFPLNGKLDEEQKQFAAQLGRTFNLISSVCHRLQTAVPAGSGSLTHELRRVYLNYALHLADVAMGLCVPTDYLHRCESTDKFMQMRARVHRNISTLHVEMARADEVGAK